MVTLQSPVRFVLNCVLVVASVDDLSRWRPSATQHVSRVCLIIMTFKVERCVLCALV